MTLVTMQGVHHGAPSGAGTRLPWGRAGAAGGSLWELGVRVENRLHWRGFKAQGTKEDAAKTPHGSAQHTGRVQRDEAGREAPNHFCCP